MQDVIIAAATAPRRAIPKRRRGNPGRAFELATIEIVCRAFRIIDLHRAASDRLRVPEVSATLTKQSSTPVTGVEKPIPETARTPGNADPSISISPLLRNTAMPEFQWPPLGFLSRIAAS